MNSTFEVGAYLIDSDSIYIITKIDKDRLFYRPSNPVGRYASVSGSIPLQNILSSGFRSLLDKVQIHQFINLLSIKKPLPELIDPRTYKELCCLNNPTAIIPLLQQLWTSQNTPNTNFSGSSRDTFEHILNHLGEELAHVLKITPDTARKKLLSALSASYS